MRFDTSVFFIRQLNNLLCEERVYFKRKVRNVKLLTKNGQQLKLFVFLTKSLINGTRR
jgi:hypothetical protein